MADGKSNPDLQFFYGDTCPFTAKVEPAVKKMEDSLNVRLTRYEVYKQPDNKKLLVTNPVWAEKCGGVPFFLNIKTGAVLCGQASVEDLQNWARGALSQ